MLTSLQIGKEHQVDLELPDSVIASAPPKTAGVEDAAATMAAALADPIDFPSLQQIVLPDDAVAIALQPGLPCAPDLLAGVVSALMAVGVPPELVQVVRTADDFGFSDSELLEPIGSAVAARIEVLRHDPADRESLSFLGPSKDGQAVYVSRPLCDAAVVIPIGAYSKRNQLGVHHTWFPAFADAGTQERFNKSLSKPSKTKTSKRKMECDEVAGMLGVAFTTSVVPGGDAGLLHVLAGEPKAVWAKGQELAQDAWRITVGQRVSLVIAAVGGGSEQQTWENVVQSIETTLEVLDIDGAIVVCSKLRTKPGPALRRLARAEDFESAERAICRKPTSDAAIASRLNHALQRARIYLLSELDEATVEDLGIAYVSHGNEIEKLSTQHDSCLVLQNAQLLSISLTEEAVQ